MLASAICYFSNSATRTSHARTAWYSAAHSPGRCLAAPPPRAKPGSRVRSGLPHSRELTAEARPVELTFARELDHSDDVQDRTLLPYPRFACSPHYLPTMSTLPEECRR